MKCERCGKEAGGYELFDYCGICGKNMCPDCMEQGCCGITPAVSGNDADLEESDG